MKTKPKIIHIMADGKTLKSIKGHVIPAGNPVYEIILKGETGKCINVAGSVL